MGRIFLEHLGGLKLFNCAECHTNLTNRSQLISTRFTGATGEFSKCKIMYHLLYPYLLSPSRTCLSLQACRQLDLQCNSGTGDAHRPPHGARCHVQELWGQARLDVRIRNGRDAEVSTPHTTPHSSTVQGRSTVELSLTLALSHYPSLDIRKDASFWNTRWSLRLRDFPLKRVGRVTEGNLREGSEPSVCSSMGEWAGHINRLKVKRALCKEHLSPQPMAQLLLAKIDCYASSISLWHSVSLSCARDRTIRMFISQAYLHSWYATTTIHLYPFPLPDPVSDT